MDYTLEQLEKIKQYAADGMAIEDIAVLLSLDEETFREHVAYKKHQASIAFRQGIAETKHAILKKEIEFAKLGSPAGVKTWIKYHSEQNT